MRSTFRQTLRGLLRAPWYSFTIVGVIALGMTLATTVFAIVDGVVLRPLPYPDASRLFSIEAGFIGIDPAKYPTAISRKDLAAWSAAAPGASFTGYRAARWVDLGPGVNQNTDGMAQVEPNFFDVIGVRPMIGGLEAADFVKSSLVTPVLIGYDAWQSRFQGDPNIIGRVIELDRVQHVGLRIAGVMPRGFVFPSERADVNFIAPNAIDPAEGSRSGVRMLEAIARVPPTMTPAELQSRIEAGMKVTAASVPPKGPKPEGWSDRGWRMQGPVDRAAATPLATSLGSKSRPLFSAVLLVAFVLVALTALNASGLMAARVLDRGREIGVRRALGATRFAISGLIFTETFVMIAAGALLGLLLTPAVLGLALSLLPEEIVLLKAGRVNWRVAAFVLASTVAIAIPAAILPVRRARRLCGAGSAGRATERVRSLGRVAIIGLQVAAGFVLTVTGALLVTSILSVYANPLLIHTRGVLMIEGSFQGAGGMNQRNPARTERVAAMLARLRGIPGVAGAAATEAQVLSGGNWGSPFKPPATAANPRLDVDIQSVTSDYYRVLQPQLIEGRLPTDAELASDARLLVVSEGVARNYWPKQAAVGQELTDVKDPSPYAVIGVVKDVRWHSWDVEVGSIYGPYARLSRYPFATVFLQTSGNTSRIMEDAMRALNALDPLYVPSRAGTLDDFFVDSVRARRFQSWLFGSFAAAGLLVVGVGVLGLLAMSTARRTREIGIRSALGATRACIVRLLLREQLTAVIAGLAVGGVVAAWTVTLVRSFLYGVTPSDARVWLAAVGLILAAAAIGALGPALRASRTDPARALRAD